MWCGKGEYIENTLCDKQTNLEVLYSYKSLFTNKHPLQRDINQDIANTYLNWIGLLSWTELNSVKFVNESFKPV